MATSISTRQRWTRTRFIKVGRDVHRIAPNAKIFIRGDRDTYHGDIMRLIEQVRAAGFYKIAFEMKSPSLPTATPTSNSRVMAKPQYSISRDPEVALLGSPWRAPSQSNLPLSAIASFTRKKRSRVDQGLPSAAGRRRHHRTYLRSRLRHPKKNRLRRLRRLTNRLSLQSKSQPLRRGRRRAPPPEAKTKVAENQRPTGSSRSLSFHLGQDQLISAPRPTYPYEARRAKQTGSGKFLITFRRRWRCNGRRRRQSTGSPILDQTSINTFRRWRCKPGVYNKVYVPITYTMEGAQL